MRVAFLGTGLLGRPMAERLLAQGHELRVWNRTRAKAEPLAALGAEVASTAAAALGFGDCAILMLADAPAIREVILRDRAACGALEGRTVLQMGTIRPAESLALAAEVRAAGGDWLEAPVLGSIPQARDRALVVMVGATDAQFARWRPLLEAFGPDPRHVGPLGRAAALKLALNQLIASLTAAFSLSLGLVLRSGVRVEDFLGILRESALHAPTFDKKLPNMLERRFGSPNFPLKHLLKDIDLVAEEAASLGLETAGIRGVREVVAKARDAGLADLDYSALYEAVDPARKRGGR